MEISPKSSLPIIKTGLRRWSSSLSAMKTNLEDAPLQSSLDRYKEKNAGEVPKGSHHLDHVGGSLMQKLIKITQGTLQLQNSSSTDLSPSYLSAPLSPDVPSHPSSITQKHVPMPLERLAQKWGKGRSICMQSYPCNNREAASELNQEVGPHPSSNKKSSVSQSKYEESAYSVEMISEQGSSYEARNYCSENKAGKATTPSVLPGYCEKNISTKRSHSLQDNSKKMVPCNYNSVDLEQNGNKGILKFVPPGTEKGDILLAFLGWADILEIEISDDGDVYRLAYIYFKNKEELVKALNRTDLIVRNKNVVLEAASTMENVCNKLPELGWVGAQTVPHEVVKNASRTVMIRRSGCKITLRELRKTVALCGGNMSGILFGPSSSSAYVEFETEDDKERALAKHPIYVKGEPISILRIDTPRTTVVRISYGDMSGQKVSSICASLGKVKHFIWRCPGIVDAHYSFSEWPKMVDILNGLNGLDLEGNRVLAQPATDYPPDVLNSLWSQPGERKHIRKMVLDLLEKLRNNSAQTVDLIRLADRFYNSEL